MTSCMKIHCDKCKWFNKNKEFYTTQSGECHRHPPIVLMDKECNFITKFPYVHESNFCGDAEKEREERYA